MPQMSVKPFSSRYFRWAAARVATALLPPLHAHVPMYGKTVPITEGGHTDFIEETQSLTLSSTEIRAARRTREGVPVIVERSIALVRLTDVTILGNTGAVIDENHHRLLVPRDGRSTATYHELRGEPTKRIVKKDSVYFNMLGPHQSHRHHFHFLIDYLPRLHYFLERFAEGREPVTVLVNEDLSPLQTKLFGVLAAQHRDLRFEAVSRQERWMLPLLYHVDDFQTVPYTNIAVQRTCMGPPLLQFLRNTAFAACNSMPGGRADKRLYVARSDTKKRHILNEAQFADALVRNGFETVLPGTLSFEEQVALFSRASVICGAHGAGLTNMIFAPPGAHVIEILPADRTIAAYLMLAKSAGHSYEAITGSTENHRQHFTCDAREVAAALDALSESHAA